MFTVFTNMKKSKNLLLIVISFSCLLTACANPFMPPSLETSPNAPSIPEAPKKALPQVRSCDAKSVADAKDLMDTYWNSYREFSGMEINTYLFPAPDLRRDDSEIKPVIKAVRLSALGLQLDERCMQVADCKPTDENKAEMSKLFHTCHLIGHFLVGNIFGMSPTNKVIHHDTGYINTQTSYEMLCKDKEPTDYLNARDADQIPLGWVERGIWLSAPHLVKSVKAEGLNEKNKQLYSDLIYLCKIYKESDKEQYCSIKDLEVLSRCDQVEVL